MATPASHSVPWSKSTGTDRDTLLFDLAQQLHEAKRAEDAAKAARCALEERVADLAGFDKPEGQATIKLLTPGGSAKLTIKQNVYTSALDDEINAVRAALGPGVFAEVFKQKWDVSVSGLKALDKADHDAYLVACRAVKRTPGKVSVAVADLETTEVAP